ncbi:unnamed protein product [Cercopithifilaria johnstoni]|uniref:Uncharacterized protein n=1 Tax=Cercopithifilaria johnstoni TaxID=2874296 RepID=A0A8J2LQ07_9BILA|nr:unnamed protein product [Cercopithifilaria johnstoni]
MRGTTGYVKVKVLQVSYKDAILLQRSWSEDSLNPAPGVQAPYSCRKSRSCCGTYTIAGFEFKMRNIFNFF